MGWPPASFNAGGRMGGAVVIPLVGLVFPILLAVGAVGAGGAVVTYTAYKLWHDRERHNHFRWLHH